MQIKLTCLPGTKKNRILQPFFLQTSHRNTDTALQSYFSQKFFIKHQTHTINLDSARQCKSIFTKFLRISVSANMFSPLPVST